MAGLQGQLEQLGVPRSYARELVEHIHQLEAVSNCREVRMIQDICFTLIPFLFCFAVVVEWLAAQLNGAKLNGEGEWYSAIVVSNPEVYTN